MNILFLDYLSRPGHKNFNKIHISALLNMGHSLALVGRQSYFDNINSNSGNVIKYSVPEVYYKQMKFAQLTTRILNIMCLLWIKKNVNLNKYDCIIVPTYESLSLFVFRTKKRMVVINHDGRQVDFLLKRLLIRLLPKQCIHIALNEDMEFHLKGALHNKKIYLVPHGVLLGENKMERPSFIKEDERFVFCPINNNFDKTFVKNIFNNNELKEFLSKNDIRLYAKKGLGVIKNEVVKEVQNRLSQQEYNYMLTKAIAVVLPYNNQFRYRCSGIFFECVARETPVLVSNKDAFSIYEKRVNMFMFNEEKGLINSISKCFRHEKILPDQTLINPAGSWQILLSSM